MATDLERLVVQLSADVKRFEREMSRARNTANRELGQIERRAKQANANISRSLSLGSLGKSFAGGVAGGILAGFSIDGAQKLIDASVRIKNALKTTGLEGEELTKVYNQLFTAAQKNAAPIESLVDLYSKVSLVQKELGVSSQELIGFTENVSLALRAGGTNAQQASGSLLQLSQALGGGTVRAEEFNSMLEGTPTIVRAVALGLDEAGGSVAKLRQLVIDGEISSREFFEAFQKGAPQLAKLVDGASATIAQGFTRLSNTLIDVAGKLNDVSNISGRVGSGFDALSSILSNLATVFEKLANSPIATVASKLDQLNEVLRKFEPISNAFSVLAGSGGLGDAIGDFITQDDVENLQKANDELDKFVERIRAGAKSGVVSPEQLKAVEDLREKLKAGTITADEARKAIQSIADTSPNLSQLPRIFDPIITQLENLKKAAEDAADAILKIPDDPRAGGFAFQSQREQEIGRTRQFFSEEEAAARRTEQEKQIADKTKEVMDKAKEAGVELTEAVARIEAMKLLGIEEGVKTFEGAIKGFVDRVVQAESGGNATAKNPRSSATGLGQFIEKTWIKLFQENFPDRAAGMTRSAILALRNDAATSRTLIEAYARQNAEFLQRASVSVDEAALQLAHFLGPQGAVNVLKAAPGTPVSQVLDPGAIRANPEVLGGGATVEDVIAYAQARAGLNTVMTQELEIRQRNRQVIADMIAQGQEETARIQLETSLIGASNAEREKEIFIFERLNELKREGIPITDELLAQVEAEANARFQAVSAYDAQAEAADRLGQAQEELAEIQSQVADAFKGALRGFIDDLIEGKSLTEALSNALGRLADRLIDIALDSIFNSLFGGGIGGGLFGFKKGGIAAHGRPRAFASGGVSRTAAIFGEAGPEAAVPLPDGRRIPVEIRLPKMRPASPDSNSGRQVVVHAPITVVTQDAETFRESENQIATRTAATMERTMRTR